MSKRKILDLYLNNYFEYIWHNIDFIWIYFPSISPNADDDCTHVQAINYSNGETYNLILDSNMWRNAGISKENPIKFAQEECNIANLERGYSKSDVKKFLDEYYSNMTYFDHFEKIYLKMLGINKEIENINNENLIKEFKELENCKENESILNNKIKLTFRILITIVAIISWSLLLFSLIGPLWFLYINH